jgi:hypothetical protein
VRQPAPAPARPAVPPQPKRRGGVGRAIRRTVATALLVGGVTFGAIQYGPIISPMIEQFIEQNFSSQIQPEPANQPANSIVVEQFTTPAEIIVTKEALPAIVTEEMKKAYLAQAQQQFPGAQLATNPAWVGPIEETELADGTKRISGTLQGYINVSPQ